MADKFCSDCGKRAAQDAKFCSGCGRTFEITSSAPKIPYEAPRSERGGLQTWWQTRKIYRKIELAFTFWTLVMLVIVVVAAGLGLSKGPLTQAISRITVLSMLCTFFAWVGLEIRELRSTGGWKSASKRQYWAAMFIGFLFFGVIIVSAITTPVTPPGPPSTASPPNSPTALPTAAALSMSSRLDESFRNQGFVIVTPFTETRNQYRNLVYTGTIDDGDNVLQQYQHKLTIEVVSDRSNALTRFNAYKTAAIKSGDYTPNTVNDTGWWHGWSDQRVSTWYSVKDVNININEPKSAVSFSRIFVTPVYVKGIYWDTYTVSVDYATHK